MSFEVPEVENKSVVDFEHDNSMEVVKYEGGFKNGKRHGTQGLVEV